MFTAICSFTSFFYVKNTKHHAGHITETEPDIVTLSTATGTHTFMLTYNESCVYWGVWYRFTFLEWLSSFDEQKKTRLSRPTADHTFLSVRSKISQDDWLVVVYSDPFHSKHGFGDCTSKKKQVRFQAHGFSLETWMSHLSVQTDRERWMVDDSAKWAAASEPRAGNTDEPRHLNLD